MASESLSLLDPSSYSNPDLAVVTNIFLSLDANFEKKIFSGNVDLTVKKIDESVNEIILDAKDLTIDSIHDKQSGKKLDFSLSESIPEFGSKLTVQLPQQSDNYTITINYQTSPSANGLQWLSPEQTSGKQHPYVFSQFQTIAARSFLPCQDTPLVKIKYQAVISVPAGLTALMSAICDSSKSLGGKTLFHFEQGIPIPSYLIAIAIGALQSRDIGPRSKLWAEKEVIDAAEYEFADTDHQLRIAEDICGTYVWGRYDLLVLPPSFPLGGMENPCLTFLTPTVLAGDRSLVNVIAHEIAHSWTGNLITNANFEHFWLNEGFTVFIERKIVGRLVNKQLQDFESYAGLQDLKEIVSRLGATNPLTRLVVDLKGVHPDETFSVVPYEKGQLFLRYLESIVGGPEVFEPFLRKYLDTYKYKSITTDVFKSFFEAHFSNLSNIKNIDWQTWLYAPGMPPVLPDYDMTLYKICDQFTDRFVSWNVSDPTPFTDSDVKSLKPEQIQQLLDNILNEEPQEVEKLRKFDEKFKVNQSKNSEIKLRWLRVCLKAHWEEKIDDVLNWVVEVGRMKYLRLLYRDLYDWEVARPRAIQVYNANKNNMMHLTAYYVGKDLRVTTE